MAEKIMNSYETIFIIDSTLEPDALTAVKDKFVKIITDHAEIGEVEEWGKKRLAYEIQKEKEGFYYFIHFEAETAAPAEIESRVRIMEPVLRFLCVKQDA